MVEYLYKGSKYISIQNNKVQYNAGYGVETIGATNIHVLNNNYRGNGKQAAQQMIRRDKTVTLNSNL